MTDAIETREKALPTITQSGSSRAVTLFTLLRYLVGNKDAILQIVQCPHAVWLGLLFVLSAGLAREYDGEDLLHEPWHALLPLAASLGTSFVLYLLIRAVAWGRGAGMAHFFLGYRSFLGLYWFTAPLAWLYAIPFEQFLSPADATRANLSLLAVVSIWRVLLITRSTSVITGGSFFAVLFPVMLFADTVALAAISFIPRPIFAIMGGVRLSETERVVLSVTHNVEVLGALSFLIWLLGTLVVFARRDHRWTFLGGGTAANCRVSISCWLLASMLLVGGLVLLPWFQPAQQLRWQVEHDLKSGRIDDAVTLMSRHDQGDFPPGWDPPPRVGYGEEVPPAIEVLEAIENQNARGWVRTTYLDKFSNSMHNYNHYVGDWIDLPPDKLERRVALLERLPECQSVLQGQKRPMKYAEERKDISESLRRRIAQLAESASDSDD